MKYKKKCNLIIMTCLLLYLLVAQLIQYAINDGNVCIFLENNCVSKDVAVFDVYIDNNLIISANVSGKELLPIPACYNYALSPGFHKLTVRCDGMYKEETFFVLFIRYIDVDLFTDYNNIEFGDECFLYVDISTLFFTIRRFYA